MPPANAPTCVKRVGVPNPITGAPTVISTKPILNYEALHAGLQSHPDKSYVDRILNYALHGVPIGYTGPRVKRECKNWPSVNAFRTDISKSIANDIRLGRKAGPFDYVPFDYFVGSPMGAFMKRSGKVRCIHDLSWPPGLSVNDYISSEEYTLQYMSMDDLTYRIKHYGPGTLIGKLDLAEAFKHILVRPEDWDLLGSVYTEYGQKKYYVDLVLPFGLRSSPKLFNDFADALQHIMLNRGVTECYHYMDDYVTLGPPDSTQCATNLNTMLQVCEDVGFGVNPQKLVKPNVVIEFIGFVVDTIKMELRISDERRQKILAELSHWEGKKVCTKRELLSLIGKLMFISKVVRSGRTFVRRLIELSKRVKYLHYRVRLNRSAREDIRWWQCYLPSWNGVGIMYDEHWTSNAQLQMFSDASDIAIAAYFNGEWCYRVLEPHHKVMSINWRELFALVTAVDTFGRHLAGKRLKIYCDNQSVCYILKSGTSKNADIMTLVRLLFYLCAHYQLECSAIYLPTYDNAIADSLSRLQFDRFKLLAPLANSLPSPVANLDHNIHYDLYT